MSDMTEAPYSANFRMYFGSEPFQFTVRRDNEADFIIALTAMVQRLEGEGWEFIGSLAAKGVLPPMDKSTGAAAAAAYTSTLPTSPSGATPGLKFETVTGYVVGAYNDKSGEEKPVLWLYCGNQKFRSYTIYPDRHALVPFEFPTTIEWNGSAPDKETAIKRNVFHPMPFQLPVLPERDPDGNLVVNKNGYQKYRLPRRDEMAGIAAPSSSPTVHAEVSFAAKPKGEMHSNDALRWSMADDQQVVDELQLEAPYDQWLMNQRNNVFSTFDFKSDTEHTTRAHYDLINSWVSSRIRGIMPDTVVSVKEVGEVSLFAVVMGILIDRYTDNLEQIPLAVTTAFLQQASPKRGIADNPNYNQSFDDNMTYVIGQALEILGDSTTALF